MTVSRDRLGALAEELSPNKLSRGKPTGARRCRERSFDDGTIIELQTEEVPYVHPADDPIPVNDEQGADGSRPQGFSHWAALRDSWPSENGGGESVDRRRARRRRNQERGYARSMGASDLQRARPAPAEERAVAPEPAPPADGDGMFLDVETLKKDLEGLPVNAAPPPRPVQPAQPPAPDADATPPAPTHQIFDELRQGRAGQALAAMKSATKAPAGGNGHQVFDRFPRGLSQAATYDVGTFDVKRRFDELDRRLDAASAPPPPSPRPTPAATPQLLPFELRADLDQLQADTGQPKGVDP